MSHDMPSHTPLGYGFFRPSSDLCDSSGPPVAQAQGPASHQNLLPRATHSEASSSDLAAVRFRRPRDGQHASTISTSGSRRAHPPGSFPGAIPTQVDNPLPL
jgi:hypothetical protein